MLVPKERSSLGGGKGVTLAGGVERPAGVKKEGEGSTTGGGGSH